MFVLYRDPALTRPCRTPWGLPRPHRHRLRIRRAADERENDVVIAHELLHTLGATDKYSVVDDAPRFPEGYGNPAQVPLFPNRLRN